MKHITIIAPDNQTNLSTVACIAGAYEIFARATEYFEASGNKGTYRVEIAGLSRKADLADGMFSLKTDVCFSEISKTDLIVIPSLDGSFETAKNGNIEIVEWILERYKHGAEIATMCSGVFMLASAGILDGKSCSTHWNYADKFKALFPKVKLQATQLITDENGIYTNGGAYSFLNLVIYLVEKYYNRQTAIFCSKVFQIEIDRHSQSPFIIFKGQKQHGDEMVRQAQAYIESQLTEKISVEDLSSRFFIGRRNFDRRFIKATGNTPLEYAQRVKVESAKKNLETTRKSVNEVMYEVGYSDLKAFREVFRKHTGLSPQVYRSRYNKEA
ncbi:GlxA family transcriptional regulator [Dyadobacter sp. BHUBP1]|uniref:GlxA family transcriptional regulator n=1 Tax=Dyadobacter sp. BHUBP1 TaxID=3424178 RepID=UPI003D3443CD